jgi:hypothetical protein
VDVELPLAGPGGRSYAFIIDWHIRLLVALFWMLIATVIANVAGITGPGLREVHDRRTARADLSVLSPGRRARDERPDTGQAHGGCSRRDAERSTSLDRRHPDPQRVPADRFAAALYTVGLLSTLVTRDSVRIGDLAAGTVLVYLPENSRKASERQAVLATQTRLAPDEAELVSDVVERWPQLAPATRRQLAVQLLARAGLPAADMDNFDDARLAAALRELLVPQQ